MMKRRTFLSTTAAAAVGTQVLGGVPLKAFSPADLTPLLQDDNDRTLIVIQLFGGNDGLNTIIPADDDTYYQIRPGIAVPKVDAVNVLSRVYMHPALDGDTSYNMRRMFEDGRLAIVQGIGYENPNLSHFRSTDIFLSGFNPQIGNDQRLTDGWLGRFWSERVAGFPETLPDHPTAVQIGGTLSMLFQSTKGDIGIALSDPQRFFELGQGLSPDLDPMSEDTRYGSEFNFVRLVAEQSDRYSSVVKEAYDNGKNMVSYPKNGFVQQMQLVARLISGGLKSKVFLVFMGGFDTHVQQQGDDLSGLHPYLLESLSAGVGLFMQDALAQGFGDKVVGMTVSEFGRRPYENGSRGTDHGASSVQFVFGNQVRSGVYGTNPDLQNTDSNGDVRYQWDYRRVYTDILETWFGGTAEDTTKVFGETILPLGVLQAQSTSVKDYHLAKSLSVTAYPNPTSSTLNVKWYQPTAARVIIEMFSTEGRRVETLWSGRVLPGEQSIGVSPTTSGTYLCAVTVNGVRSVVPVSVVR